ncbi:conserved hypothetical protein [Actinacidiphila cocklensis]|uniref:Uncharacterized protein n=1 Tax=Actinacidiphila cocklensis TaxID=887465 RepID=A0A9W4DNE5_9ACTN|nr:conserved hypothetical protein [Actinacidiphila cocklensis]
MVEKEPARRRMGPVQELAKRLGVALSARMLWTLAVRLIDHH